jgi:uncharacterized protein (TIGR03000 family)
MFRRALSFGGLLIQAGALLLLTPGFGEAAGHGGGHFGGGGFRGGHVGGAHFGGFRGSFSHGGFYGHPYAHYGYHHHYGGYGYGRGRYYPYYGGFSAYPNYGYSGSYVPYSYAVPEVRDDAGYAGSYEDAAPSNPDEYPSAAAAAGGYTSYYPPATAQPDTSVHVTVNVPADAKLWFDAAPTTSTGPVRVFNSPRLAPGRPYTYELRAQWNENGHEVTQTQQVGVTAGAHVHVSFPVPPRTAGQSSAVNKG